MSMESGTGIRVSSLRRQIQQKRSWKDLVKEFFGVQDEDDEEREVWKARRKYYLKNRWIHAIREETDARSLIEKNGGDDDEPDGIAMKETTKKNLLPKTQTGRKRVKDEAPEHRVRPMMPSVFSMVVSGVRTLLKPTAAAVGNPLPVHNVRSFRPDGDSDEASDISDDGRSFFGPDDEELMSGDETDRGPGVEPPKAVAEHVTLEGSRPWPSGDFSDGQNLVRRPTLPRAKPRGFTKRPLPRMMALKDDRRYAGIGIVGRWFNRSYKMSALDKKTMKKLEDPEMHRPYFTWWLMTVQLIVMIVSMAVYGIAPIGLEFKTVQAQVMTTSLAIESRGYKVEQNFWIGPSYEDLIHLGAKFAPCMRRDKRVFAQIEKERQAELYEYGCCVRLDRIGCVMTSAEECAKSLFTQFVKYNVTYFKYDDDNNKKISGPLCKSDPFYCTNPHSSSPNYWENDISKWPTCQSFSSNNEPHLECEGVTGRPCCIGIQGECVMATKDECDFYNGFYHENRTLCADVDCMEDVCGLTDFLHRNEPDQIYRIWISLCLHVGIIHCLISLVIEFFICRDIEKLAGWFRTMIIFVFSGIGGNIVSAFFTPYQPEVGPSGAIFGLFAALVMDVIQQWRILRNPLSEFLKLLILVLIFFVLGLLPYVDNYAHVSGFIFGLLLSAVFLPHIGLERETKVIMIAVCLPVCVALLVLFFVLFYVVDLDCEGCKYFTCIPVTDTFCLDLDQNLRKRLLNDRLAI